MGYLDRGVSKSNSIYIRSYPTSASVFLNDNSIGKTPVFVQNLKDQRIIIKLSLKPYPEVIDTIDLNDPASRLYYLDRRKSIKDNMLLRYIKGDSHHKGFFISEHVVTSSQYLAFLKDKQPSLKEINNWVDIEDGDCPIEIIDGAMNVKANKGNNPMVEVDYYGAAVYCDWISSRLPTEEEFVLAVTEGTTRLYPWGNERMEISLPSKLLQSEMLEVKSLPPTPSYVYDLSGSCWQWLQSSDETARVKGGFYYSYKYIPDYRETREFKKDYTQFDVGFRYVKD